MMANYTKHLCNILYWIGINDMNNNKYHNRQTQLQSKKKKKKNFIKKSLDLLLVQLSVVGNCKTVFQPYRLLQPD